jgi:hypothetical protein
MKPKVWCLGFLVSFGIVGAWAASHKTAPQQKMTVVVVNAHLDPAQPVRNVRVSLTYIDDSSTPITVSPEVTNREGAVALSIPLEAAQRGNLRIEITGAADLVVYQPADGQLGGLPAAVTIRLLPKGSLLLLGDAQIEKMLHRLLLQSNAKSQEIRALKAKLNLAQSQQAELAAAMTEWAKANGFAIEDVDKQVRQWAEDIQRRKEEASEEQKALAEFALKHYGIAGQEFERLFDARRQANAEKTKRYLEERRSDLRETIDAARQATNSYQLNSQYHQATQVLEEARDDAAEAHRRYPEDTALRGMWLDAVQKAADARCQEGEVGPSSDSLPLLARSVEDYRNLLHEHTAPVERKDWAGTQNNLGNALVDQGERSSGERATELFVQAVQAYQAALEVRTKADLPRDWALTQNNLGNVLLHQGERSSRERAADLFAQAVQAYRAALEVRTKTDFPQDWAETQVDLGNALLDQGERSSGERATELFAHAVQAYRAALEVLTKADLPRYWAGTQSNLGLALADQGVRSSGERAAELFAQAVQAHRAALEVRTKAELPQLWAATQNNLGIALAEQGEWSSGERAAELFAQAVQAYRAALEVLTKADLPQGWAMTQDNLGSALLDQGERSSGERASELFAQAAQACRAALEVYTKADLPQDWAGTQSNLGAILRDEAKLVTGDRAVSLLDQAVQADQKALEVFTKATYPIYWANTQTKLGDALRDEGEHATGEKAAALLEQAILAYRSALEVFTEADSPQEWAGTQIGLGSALADQGDLPAATKAIEAGLHIASDDVQLLQSAVSVYRNRLNRYDRAYELSGRWLKLDPSPDARLDFVEADLTTARFEDCAKQVALLDDSAFPAPATPMILIRDTMALACQWGAGQTSVARQTESALVSKAAGLQKTGWEFAGTRHFVASSPAFETGRASWIALFQSLEDGDSAAMTGTLRQLDKVMSY